MHITIHNLATGTLYRSLAGSADIEHRVAINARTASHETVRPRMRDACVWARLKGGHHVRQHVVVLVIVIVIIIIIVV